MSTILKKTASKSSKTTDDQRWEAVQRRDSSADGKFVYAVRTTGVYCRPNCSARQALRKNVAFFKTVAEAKIAGFRACKRCKPDDVSTQSSHALAIEAACRSIESAESRVSLDALANAADMSPSHFQRTFRSILGITPKQYEIQARRKRARHTLEVASSVTDAIYSSGFGSSSRFYEDSNQWLGMKPTAFRSGAATEKIRHSIGKCSLGQILVASSKRGICAIFLGSNRTALLQQLKDEFPKADIEPCSDETDTMLSAVIDQVENPGTKHALPLDICGTAFQQKVWQALRKIPAGKTLTYQELSSRVGHPKSARAVANACGANKLAVAIPCHRIIHKDGTLSGYRWGTDLKRKLLQRESQKNQR